MAGNKHDNGVHEVGTPETLKAYQEDTPYQNVEKYLAGIQEVIQEKKDKQKKSFMQVFQNPLKGFPYNEELDDNFVKPLEEAKRNAKFLELEFKNKNEAIKAYKHINNKLYSGGTQPFEDFVQEGKWLQFDNVQDVKDVLEVFKKGGLQFKISGGELKLGESLVETTDREIKAIQKLSKDMQSVLKGYQNATKLGDKALKDTKHNPTYKAILDARDKLITLIGTLQTDKLLRGEELEEGRLSDLLIDIQQGATAKELARDWDISLSQAKSFLRDYYGQKKGNRKEEVEETEEAFSDKQKSGKEIARKMLKIKSMKGFSKKVSQMKKVSAAELDKILPDYVSGGDIGALFEGKNLMPDIQKIVDTKGAAKVGGVMLDMFTASVITQAYAKVNDSNKKKMENSNIQTLVKLAQRLMGMKEEVTITLDLDEAKKAGKGNIKKLDIDWVGDDKLAREVKRKYKVTVKPRGRTQADVSGKKVDILKFLLDPTIMGKDSDDVEKLYPELFESYLEESIRDVENEFPRDREWKKIVKKHANAIKKFWRSGQLDGKAEEDIVGWAMSNGEIRTDDVDETDEWLHDVILANEEVISEKYKPYSDRTYPRCVDFYIQFRGGKGDRITSPENKKDFETAKKMIDSYCKKNKIKQKPVYSTPEQGSSAYKVGLMIDKTYSKTDDYDRGVDLQPLYVELGKLKTAEDHGGGWSKPHGQDEDVSEKKDKIKYRGNLRGLMEGTWALPKTSKQKKELKDLLKKPVILGKEGDDAADKLYDLIGDDGLFDDLYTAGKKNPKGDARPIIKAKMKELGIKEGKMDGQKLTGQEISVYFRRNKVRDKMTRKAVEIALDHGGAMTYAVKQIEKLKRGLSKNKDVQKALNYANFGEQVRLPEVGFMFKEDSPVAGNLQVEGDPYIPFKTGSGKLNKNIEKYWKKEIKGVSKDELLKIQTMYMITDHSGVVAMYKAGKRDFLKSLKD